MRRMLILMFITIFSLPLTSTNGFVNPIQKLKPVIVDGERLTLPQYDDYDDDGVVNIDKLIDLNKKIDALKIATMIEINTRAIIKNDSIKKNQLN